MARNQVVGCEGLLLESTFDSEDCGEEQGSEAAEVTRGLAVHF